ncbi:MAG: NADH oxidase [Myxococcales bacterium]|nr:NADH oxidase [Myxococcales bacterium]
MWTPPERIKHQIQEEQWPTVTQVEQSLLFSPLKFGALSLQQRTWVPAMVPWRATAEGEVSEDVLNWYARFAQGQPGAIVIEATGVRDIPSGPLLRIGHDRYLDGLKRLTERVQEASQGQTKLFIQLIDFLSIRRRPPSDKFFNRFLAIHMSHRQKLSDYYENESWLDIPEAQLREHLASGDQELWSVILSPRELRDLNYGQREDINDTHLEHIRNLPQKLPELFYQASFRAKKAGFDGIELHCAHAYTLASFLSTTNLRKDGYGNSLMGRLRLPLEVYEASRAAVGKDCVVGARLLVDEVISEGTRVDTSAQYAQHFAQAGMDFISCSKGGRFEDALQPKVGQAAYPYTGQSGYECMPSVYSDTQGPFGRNLSLMSQLRQSVRSSGLDTPIVVAGGINTFSLAENTLQSGHGDIIGVARGSLADPDLWLKVKLGQGTKVRRCAYTNYCEALDARHKQVTCRLWDRSNLNEPLVHLSHDGRRRLEAPKWQLELE